MKNLIKTVGVVALSAVMGSAWAECPKNLNAEQMYDCIVSETPGDDSSTRAISVSGDTKKNKSANEQPEKQVRAESVKHADM